MKNIDKLTEFNPALVYGFDAEALPDERANDIFEMTQNGTGQVDDMYEAYYYAQETILKEIKHQGIEHITPDIFKGWLHQIHLRISRTLAKNTNLQGGRLIQGDEDLVRWSPSHMISADIREGFRLLLSTRGATDNIMAQFSGMIAEKHEFDKAKLMGLFEVAKKFQRPGSDPSNTYLNIKRAIKTGQMSLQDVKKVKQVLSFTYVDGISEKFSAFADETVASWKACDRKDLDKISTFLATVFFDITAKHFYFNGNGRTATCVINIMLRSFDLPSILIRDPNERCDKGSSYVKAIEGLENDDINPLKRHIKARVEDALKGKTYQSEALKETVTYRSQNRDLLLKMRECFPEKDISRYFSDLINKGFPCDAKYIGVDSLSHPRYAEYTREATRETYLMLSIGAALMVLRKITKFDKGWSSNFMEQKIWHEASSDESDEMVKTFSDCKAFKIEKIKLSSSLELKFAVKLTKIDIHAMLDLVPNNTARASSKPSVV